MKRPMYLSPAIALLILTVISTTSHADRRNFVWTYEAKTAEAGDVEAEYYLTAFANKSFTNTDFKLDFDHELELEYGVTDHFDLAMYQMFGMKEGESFKYRGYKLRGRYRFGETGQYFMDPLVYLEVTHKPFDSELSVEQKMVLARAFGNLILSFNMSFEQEIKYADDIQEYSFVPQLALGYQIKPWFTVGAEIMGTTLVSSDKGYEHTAVLAGPTISLAAKRVWWNVGALVQATQVYDEQARFQVRSLLGVEF